MSATRIRNLEDDSSDDLARENLDIEPEPQTERQVLRAKARAQLARSSVVQEVPDEEQDA